MKVLNIYTDGGYRDKLRLGAFAYLIVDNSGQVINKTVKVCQDDEVDYHLTNNVMELQAVIKSLNWVRSNGYNPNDHRLYVNTDSQYVQLGLVEWLPHWKRNNWRNSKNKTIANKELWIILDKLWTFEYPYLHLQWIHGHDGNKFNEEVDKMCTNALLNHKRVKIIKTVKNKS